VRQLAKNGGFAVEELDHVVFSQVRKTSIELVMGELGLPIERAPMVMEDFGYTGSACLGMAFDDAVQRGRVRAGDLVAFVGSGVGYNQAGAVFRVGELPRDEELAASARHCEERSDEAISALNEQQGSRLPRPLRGLAMTDLPGPAATERSEGGAQSAPYAASAAPAGSSGVST
jgi:hypothetical protein